MNLFGASRMAMLAMACSGAQPPDTDPLEPVQLQFLRDLVRGPKEQTEGMWCGDLLYRGLIKPIAERSFTFELTDRGRARLQREAGRKWANG